MEDSSRQGRREEERRAAARRRLVAAGSLMGLIVLLAVVGIVVLGGSGDDSAGGSSSAGPSSEPAELPRGGRVILPGNQVVAYYGDPRDRGLGVLGIGSPDREAERLEKQAKPYARPGRPVLPAFELITTLAIEEEGTSGDHSLHESTATIRRYLRAARAHKMLLILDIQPGYAPFLAEAHRLEPFLKLPDVSLALDPEWSLEPPALPGQEIGSTNAATVNVVSDYLSELVRRYDLPQKLLVVHRFTEEMIEQEKQLKQHPGVALVLNVDGVGSQAAKVSKYKQLTRERKGEFNGFKLFYEEDLGLMSPAQAMRLRPQPNLVVYE